MMDGDPYADLWERALPYLDTRHNETHVRISYDYARRLLKHYPQADEAVVLPAVLLHDVGWKIIPEADQLRAFGPKMRDADLRRVHEIEGARIAREILSAAGFAPARIEEIVAIIDGHDSREAALSLNDQLMKDADKLWRFTPTGIAIDHQRFGLDLREYIAWIARQIDGWMFTPEAAAMAGEALAEARATLLGESESS